MKKLLLLTIIGLWLFPSISSAQAPNDAFMADEFPRARSLFAKAQRLMRERDYPAATDAYLELVKGFRSSDYLDIYQYALGRAYYLSGDWRQAALTLANFNVLFPHSNFVPYAYQLQANCAYRSQQLKKAFLLYINAYNAADDNRLRSLSKRSLLAGIEAGYMPSDSVMAKLPGPLVCPIKIRMAALMNSLWSQETIDSFLVDCPRKSLVEEKVSIPKENRLRVGVILPLSGPYAKYGQSILDGIMLAVELLSHERIGVEVLAYDSKADHVTSARVAIALAEAEVDMVIGPLLSNIAATVASVCSNQGISLIVPAAMQAGFTDLSSSCFQMSPNMVTIGRGMAQYAVNHRGMTTLAVITPTSIDELTMAESFVDEASRLGVRIIAIEKFRSDETDFGPYIRDIKEAILGPPDDSAFYVTLSGDTLKPGERPVAFDGLFIPANEQQLFLLLPQLDFYRVTTSYLGTDEWNTNKILRLGEKVLKDAVFYSGKAAMQSSVEFERFSSAYDIKYGKEPDRLTALGYDAINMLADAFRKGRHGPGDFIRFFRNVDGYFGASGRITFGKRRSNLELPLFTLKEGQVKPLIDPPKVEESATDSIPPDTVGVEYIKYDW